MFEESWDQAVYDELDKTYKAAQQERDEFALPLNEMVKNAQEKGFAGLTDGETAKFKDNTIIIDRKDADLRRMEERLAHLRSVKPASKEELADYPFAMEAMYQHMELGPESAIYKSEQGKQFHASADGKATAAKFAKRSGIAVEQDGFRITAAPASREQDGGLISEIATGEILRSMLYAGGMIQASQRTMVNDFHNRKYSSIDDTGEEGLLISTDTGAIGDEDAPATRSVTMDPHTLASQFMSVARPMLRVGIRPSADAFYEGLASSRLGRGWNTQFTTGAGTGAHATPAGATITAGGSQSVANNGGIAWTELATLMERVDEGYMVADMNMFEPGVPESGGLRCWQAHQTFRGQVRGLTANGAPVWGEAVGPTPATLAGWPFLINNKILQNSSTGRTAGDTVAMFGNFSYYLSYFVGTVEMFRIMDSVTLNTNTVKYLALSYGDGAPIGGQGAGSARTDDSNAWAKLVAK